MPEELQLEEVSDGLAAGGCAARLSATRLPCIAWRDRPKGYMEAVVAVRPGAGGWGGASRRRASADVTSGASENGTTGRWSNVTNDRTNTPPHSTHASPCMVAPPQQDENQWWFVNVR